MSLMNDPGPLDRLKLIVEPPEPSPWLRTGWQDAEEEYGLRFSKTFEALLEAYGEGVFGDRRNFFHPTDPRDSIRGATHIENALHPFSMFTADEYFRPLPAHPDDGPALFPVGSNGSVSEVYLIVEDGVASDDRLWVGNQADATWMHSEAWHQVEGPLAALLERLVTGYYAEGRLSQRDWTLQPTFAPAFAEHD